ncbi:MAG TPA: isoprenylcysteine carboxylmethyltransferase family protein [Thermodesulfobacteriota bacterium]|nr:isoprenylcysteine carboxylmethyltransferase family protein [Thermodesulfobacteriota bacterium]
MIAFWLFLLFVILQRLTELLIAKRNERILKAQGGIEFDKNGYRVIVIMHVAFFVSLICEKVFLSRMLNSYWIIFAALFGVAQFLRYWAIKSLGVYWNTKILVLPTHKLVNTGPYKYLRHPNYIAVVIEFAVIPLIFSCYLTAFVFSLINLILLRRRIKIEESAIRKASIGFATLL